MPLLIFESIINHVFVSISDCSSSTPAIDHGSFTPNNDDFGDTRNGQCDTNYILSIDPCTIECQTNGKWSSHSCTCDGKFPA